MKHTPRTHYRACNLCEAICGLEIQVSGDEILSIRGDQEDPLSQGHICPKGVALQDIYQDPDRLRQPVRRTATGWETISWTEAFDEVATRLQHLQATAGRSAVGVYLGNPNTHNFGTTLFLPDFLRSLKTPNLFSATSADQLPHHFVAYLMFGHYFLLPVPDLDRTDYLLVLGANPLVSNGSLMTAPAFPKRMRAIQARGRVVVVDPRRTETADKADEHLFIRPGTDALFLLAIVHTLFAEGLVQLGALADHVKNLEPVAAAVQAYTPERVAASTGVAAAKIKAISREFAAAERAVCYGRMGVSTQEFGGLCNWLVNLVNILTGNFDRPGGAMFTTPAVDTVLPNRAGKLGRWSSRVSQHPERFGELPVAALTEEILTPGDGQIRALVTSAGNPVLSTANGAALDEALGQLDFMVAIDIYLNETTRHAHIILPPTTGLETTHYDVVFHTLAVRNTAKFSEPCFEKTADQRHDYEIFQELTRRLTGGTYDPPFATPTQMVDAGLRFGAYGKTGLSVQQLQDHPHGIDLGPLQPVLPGRLFTEDKKIDLAPASLLADLVRLDGQLVELDNVAPDFPLRLIGRRQLRSNNSWMHNSQRLVKGGDRCTLLVHPDDAAAAGMVAGQVVTVQSAVGSLQIAVEISDEVMPGVVSIPHGWGHTRRGTQQAVAEAHPGVSMNDITDPHLLDALTGNAVFNGVPVRVVTG
ncbi:MAG: dehydrogenase [Bacteroidetes bacterium]|nr:MAG: dehydrogenase [Bacteroidota bacterium]PTM11729.1 MAG: dehydrogenase [Bacteroidota bacterium]